MSAEYLSLLSVQGQFGVIWCFSSFWWPCIYFWVEYSGIFVLLSLYIAGILLMCKWPSRASRPLGLLFILSWISRIHCILVDTVETPLKITCRNETTQLWLSWCVVLKVVSFEKVLKTHTCSTGPPPLIAIATEHRIFTMFILLSVQFSSRLFQQ